ncbi:putative conjugative transfer protein TraI [Orientia tsutsugamushi str. Kato PP]|uniref:Conjugal transfer protein TraA n=1 Tax=Orientia tsutsugamushi TaxID=784 RepID=A0A2U3RBH0_ORITS|nr:hypothetical protein [Orientia tsutsugamushi]KJV52080.1 putative conjugative transfer protein TraI [Orientia tsutsugamushi str. Kato PP]SPR10584.1 conjugal transfer protein TraA [Orientia tsutsugamushi]
MEGKSHIWQEIESYFKKSYKDLQIQNSEFATLTSVNKNEFVAKTDAGKEVSFDSVKYNLNMAMLQISFN